MSNRIQNKTAATALALSLIASAPLGHAQSAPAQEDDGIFTLGSIFVSIFHVPLKLVTCVGTQVTAAAAYAATYDVRGHYDGGTYGREIGETARRSCTGTWFVPPSQIKADFGR
jgi:hypothetical protein